MHARKHTNTGKLSWKMDAIKRLPKIDLFLLFPFCSQATVQQLHSPSDVLIYFTKIIFLCRLKGYRFCLQWWRPSSAACDARRQQAVSLLVCLRDGHCLSPLTSWVVVSGSWGLSYSCRLVQLVLAHQYQLGSCWGGNAAVPRIQGDWDVSECGTLSCHYTFECVNSLEDTNTRGCGQKEEQFKKKFRAKIFPKICLKILFFSRQTSPCAERDQQHWRQHCTWVWGGQ